jgi:hypothetical protein
VGQYASAGGGGSGGGGGSVSSSASYSVAQKDFTAARHAADTLALTFPVGFFVPTVQEFTKVMVRDATGLEIVYDPETTPFLWTVGTGELQVVGGVFAVADLAYDVEVTGPPRTSTANAARSAATLVQPVQHVAADGTVQPSGSLSTNPVFARLTDGTDANAVGKPLYSQNSTAQELAERFRSIRSACDDTGLLSYRQGDFTVTREADNVTLTLAGMPQVPSTVYQLVGVYGGAVAGLVDQVESQLTGPAFVWTPGVGGGTLVRAAGTWPAIVMGLAWAVARRNYSVAADSLKTTEQSPVNNVVIEESLIDTTTVATGTDYLPSSDGIALLGYRDLTLTGKLIDADGAITLTFEGTNDEDATAASRDWISIYGIRTDKAAGLGYVNTVAIHDSTETFAIDFDRLNYKYFRVKYVVLTDVAASNTIIVKCRRQA